MTEIVLIMTTVATPDEAERIAHALVEERLAACVNVHSAMISTYRWKDGIEVEPERQIVIKTTRARLPALEARLKTLHPYELPEWIVLGAEASAAYGQWVIEMSG